jgi:hypothetical protein
MKKILGILIIGLIMLGCKSEKKTEQFDEQETEMFNQDLVDELEKMGAIDQLAASNAYPPENYSYLSQEEWSVFKDSVYTTHQMRIKEIFDQYGFAGYNLVGEKGSSDFWVMVQHSDHNPEFQLDVLGKMKIEVEKGNADSRNYGMLIDRVKLNTGQAQIYGTQVDYNNEICQAFPRNLADSVNVNKRRKEIGLQPLEEYLNEMTLMHFEMNKDYYAIKGILEPKLYEIE